MKLNKKNKHSKIYLKTMLILKINENFNKEKPNINKKKDINNRKIKKFYLKILTIKNSLTE